MPASAEKASESTSPASTLVAPTNRSAAIYFFIFILLAAAIGAIGYISYQNYRNQFRLQVEQQLSAIAQLKVTQLGDWRTERLGDGQFLSDNGSFAVLVREFFANPQAATSQAALQAWLDNYRVYGQYDRARLLDLYGRTLLSAPQALPPLPSEVIQQIPAVQASGQVALVDFYRDPADQNIYLNVLIPIFNPSTPGQVIAVVSLRIDPSTILYPYISAWPASSTSAETLLVRRDGNDVLYLNALKFQPDSTLNLRIPLTDTQVLAVKAVLGQTGVVQGLDYRGQAVIGALAPIPGSPWFLVARMDVAEVYAPLVARLWETVLLFGLLLVITAAGLAMNWRQNRLRFYRVQAAAALALRDSEMRYRRLFEAARDGIFIVDADTGKVINVNPFMLEIMGYPPEKIVGKTLWELGFFKDIAASRANFLELQQKDYVRYEDLPLEAADGRRLHVEFVSNVYTVDHSRVVQCNIRDITERKLAADLLQARLRLVEFAVHHNLPELLQNALDEVCNFTASPIGFYHFVEEDQQTLSMQAWSTRTLQEYCRAESSGQHYDLEQAGVWADCLRQRQAVIHNDYASLPGRKGLPAGHSALLRELVVPVLRDGLVVAILGVGNRSQEYVEKDIETVVFFADLAWELAMRKRAEQELARYSENLEVMVEARTQELRETQEQLVRQGRLATLGQVAGSIGHELRNPLGVISNAVYFLKMSQPDAPPTIQEYLQIIENETRTSDKFITELLDFTRIKALDRQPASVPDLLRQVLARYPAPAGVEVSLDLPEALPLVNVDPQHILQVLGNLVTNACQAMGTGGRLGLSASVKDGMVQVAIRDTGTGIRPENMKKLFEPLFTTKNKGIGLGLAVSRKLAEANGGRIEVNTEPGKGSTFTVFLPMVSSK